MCPFEWTVGRLVLFDENSARGLVLLIPHTSILVCPEGIVHKGQTVLSWANR